jgi:hypothetical protein
VRFEVERVTIEPFDLRQPCKYDVVIDRLTHWFHTSREWIKKCVIADGLYVFNNPWSVQSMEKASTYAAMIHLGLPIPETWLVPPKSHEPTEDLEPTLRSYARMFDLPAIGRRLGYPLYMKPYDGGTTSTCSCAASASDRRSTSSATIPARPCTTATRSISTSSTRKNGRCCAT